MRELAGMSVLVTGGASGIGRATAAHLSSGGARVTVLGRRGDRVAEVVDELGPTVRGVTGDVTVAADREAAITAAVEHGGGRLDALVNNAGNMYRGPIDELDEGRLLELFHTNVVGAMLLTGLARSHLERTGGAVLFVGSVHTRRAFPGASPYAATKGAVEALTGVLAAELGPTGVRVACVRPGAVPTEINVRAGLVAAEENLERLTGLAPAHALGRIGTPQDVAEAFEYLIRAEWVTGAILDVDGGLSLGVTNA
jgi:NAD(P)-dependent dehydrogenase (short-subunit alcohol dehydrogenase family)